MNSHGHERGDDLTAGQTIPQGDTSTTPSDTDGAAGTRPPQQSQIQSVEELVQHLIYQLTHGCGHPSCPASACYTNRKARSSGPVRKFSTLSARSTAIALASTDNPRKWLCPFVKPRDIALVDYHESTKIDPKSLAQLLSDTHVVRNIGQFQPAMHGTKKRYDLQLWKDEEVSAQQVSQFTIKAVAILSSKPRSLSCLDLTCFCLYLRYGNSDKQSANLAAAIRAFIYEVFSDFDRLSGCFKEAFKEVFEDDEAEAETWQVHLPCLLDGFLGWNKIIGSMILRSITRALRPFFETDLSLVANESSPMYRRPLDSFVRVAIISIAALYGHTFTAMGYRLGTELPQYHESPYASDPESLHFRDSFTYEPAMSLNQRLIQATMAISSATDRGHSYPVIDSIIELLVHPESSPATFKYDPAYRPVMHAVDRQALSLIWLQWINIAAVHQWDGQYRMSKNSVVGASLLIRKRLWASRKALSIGDSVFCSPEISDEIERNTHAAVADWLSFSPKGDTLHLLTFYMVFKDTQMLIRHFRTACLMRMREAYAAVKVAIMTRQRLAQYATPKDEHYLDQRMRVTGQHFLVLRVGRDTLLSDAFDQLWQREQRELFRPLKVRMGEDEGELGQDLGGVQVEFFNLICREIMVSEKSLFETDPHTNLAWFRPGSMEPLYRYELIGLLFGLAVYNGITLPVSFPLTFYRKLYGLKCNRSHLEEGWPSLAKGLESLLEYSGDVENDLARDFVYTLSANGLHLDVDMRDPWAKGKNNTQNMDRGWLRVYNALPQNHHPDIQHRKSSEDENDSLEATSALASIKMTDASILNLDWPGWQVALQDADSEPRAVTSENRQAYVDEYAQWVLDYSIRPQFYAFAKGFFRIVDIKAMHLLPPEIFRTLVEGHHEINVEDLKRATSYADEDYTPDSPNIRWFWEVVETYPQKKLKSLLEFVTGSSRMPVHGAADDFFKIDKVYGDPEALPSSQTCFGTLKLPLYPTKEDMAKKLDIALEHSLGFGQA